MKNLIIVIVLLAGCVLFFQNTKGTVHYKVHSTKFGTEFNISRLNIFENSYKKKDTLQLSTGINMDYTLEKLPTQQIKDTSYVWKNSDGVEYNIYFWKVVIDEIN